MEERPIYGSDSVELSAATLNRFTEGYEQPTPQEVRSLIRYLGWTGSQVAALVGVNTRTVRKWQEFKDTTKEGNVNRNRNEIPYAAWRLMLLAGKLVNEP